MENEVMKEFRNVAHLSVENCWENIMGQSL